jgi:hypothetical protein
VMINGWKDELILWKLSFIWVKILNDIACNLNWIEFEKINWTQLNAQKMYEWNWIFVELNFKSNSIAQKWDAIFCRRYWKYAHHYGVFS